MKMFNKILREKVEKEKRLNWLDFFTSLLSSDLSSLNPQYELDGTHLNPKYLSLLEVAINQIHTNNNQHN